MKILKRWMIGLVLAVGALGALSGCHGHFHGHHHHHHCR